MVFLGFLRFTNYQIVTIIFSGVLFGCKNLATSQFGMQVWGLEMSERTGPWWKVSDVGTGFWVILRTVGPSRDSKKLAKVLRLWAKYLEGLAIWWFF